MGLCLPNSYEYFIQSKIIYSSLLYGVEEFVPLLAAFRERSRARTHGDFSGMIQGSVLNNPNMFQLSQIFALINGLICQCTKDLSRKIAIIPGHVFL